MAQILNFVEEKEKRLQEHLVGKCKSDKELEDDRKKQLLLKQIAHRAASNARIIAELSKSASQGRPAT